MIAGQNVYLCHYVWTTHPVTGKRMERIHRQLATIERVTATKVHAGGRLFRREAAKGGSEALNSHDALTEIRGIHFLETVQTVRRDLIRDRARRQNDRP
jgi:hypothetical protein